VERWPLETQTFHLSVGECTVTLQDVQVLWGVPIDGGIISGIGLNMSNSEIKEMFLQLTDLSLQPESIED